MDWVNVFILSFLTFPFLLMIDRGNFDGILSIIMIAFIYFFSQKKYLISSLLLSLVIAMKVLPAVLLLLFITEKKYKALFISVISTIFLTLISILFFNGGFGITCCTQFQSLAYRACFQPLFSVNNVVYNSVSLFTLCKLYLVETGTILPS